MVAAAKNMKLPEDNNKLEEVTNIDTQASENGAVRTMNPEGQRNNVVKP